MKRQTFFKVYFRSAIVISEIIGAGIIIGSWVAAHCYCESNYIDGALGFIYQAGAVALAFVLCGVLALVILGDYTVSRYMDIGRDILDGLYEPDKQ